MQAVSRVCIRMFNEDVLSPLSESSGRHQGHGDVEELKVGAAIASADDKVDAAPNDKSDDTRSASSSPAASLYTKKVSDTREDATKEEAYPAQKADTQVSEGSSRSRRVHGIPVNADGKPKEGFFIYPDEEETAGSSEGSKRKSSTPSKVALGWLSENGAGSRLNLAHRVEIKKRAGVLLALFSCVVERCSVPTGEPSTGPAQLPWERQDLRLEARLRSNVV